MIRLVTAGTDDFWTSAAEFTIDEFSLDVEAFSASWFLCERRVFPQLDSCFQRHVLELTAFCCSVVQVMMFWQKAFWPR